MHLPLTSGKGADFPPVVHVLEENGEVFITVVRPHRGIDASSLILLDKKSSPRHTKSSLQILRQHQMLKCQKHSYRHP